MSVSLTFQKNVNYASTLNIRKVIKFYSPGNKTFETDLITLTKLDMVIICAFSPTEIKISNSIFLSSNWTVNQSSEITCQVVNALILVVRAQALSSGISLAGSKIVVSENWKNVTSSEFLALKNEMSVSGGHLS